MLATFGVMLLPELLSGEAPHALRAIGAIPYIQIMGGVFAAWGIRQYFTSFPRNVAAKYAMYGVVGVATLGTLWFSYQRYFVVWAHSEKTYEAYSRDAVDIADSINRDANAGAGRHLYVVIDGYSDKTVKFLTYRRVTYVRVDSSKLGELRLASGRDLIYTNTAKDNLKAFKALQSRYPGGSLTGNYAPYYDKNDFYKYTVTVP